MWHMLYQESVLVAVCICEKCEVIVFEGCECERLIYAFLHTTYQALYSVLPILL